MECIERLLDMIFYDFSFIFLIMEVVFPRDQALEIENDFKGSEFIAGTYLNHGTILMSLGIRMRNGMGNKKKKKKIEKL